MVKEYNGFPPQRLPFSKKSKSWRKANVEWGASKATITYNPVRKSVIHKKINYDLLDGILHMQDLELILNPDNQDAEFIPEKIQHYPIMNSKLNVLRGEESKRPFDYRVVITNPNAISEIEVEKKNQLLNNLQQLIQETSQSEEEFNQGLERISDYFLYEWQDIREIRANAILNHYNKEYNIPFMFNQGFMDGATVGEEIYQCDIVGGEPIIERLNPLKVRIFRSGYSNRIEDADIVIIDDYWSPGKIIDVYGDVLSKKDLEYIDNLPFSDGAAIDSMDNIDDRRGFVNDHMMGDEINTVNPMSLFEIDESNSLLPYDLAGNIRVCKVYWKSERFIKEVKSYDPITGEEVYTLYNEDYVEDKDSGEEVKKFPINEAWEGVKIGDSIYVNMGPRAIQYNRLGNPSRCHFGIVGSIYNINDDKPFSLVDMMKQYNYLYDAIHDRLNKLMSRNWGKIVNLDLAKVPKGWNIDKWLYYAKINGLNVTDSFKEGNIGAATGKLAGAMNNASSGYVDADFGNNIQQYINLLEFIKLEMSEVAGITKQREGQIANRETVGGVERATLQSSHITEWLFTIHEDVKRRAYECFLETAKIALKGRNKKFQYILSDGALKTMDIDGDEFAECDYGLVVDNSNGIQELNSKIETLAQAALQNQSLSFSTIMKLFGSSSLIEKQRFVEKDERDIKERQQQAQQQQLQAQQQQAEAELQQRQMELQQKDIMNQRDNETRILVAEINGQAEADRLALMNGNDGIEEPVYTQEAKDKLAESIRQFDARLKLDKEKLAWEKQKNAENNKVKKEISKSKGTNK